MLNCWVCSTYTKHEFTTGLLVGKCRVRRAYCVKCAICTYITLESEDGKTTIISTENGGVHG